jgi:GNAT superfamily N-acetyltransferase
MGPRVRAARPSDKNRVTAAIILAFQADPLARWMYPDLERYLTFFPEFVHAFGGRAFEHRTAHLIEHARAASLWLPPGVHPDEEAITSLIRESVPAGRREDLFLIHEQLASYHPGEPHWHLPLMGVAPAEQRKGYGSALLTHALQACDEGGVAAYVECSNPENVPLYRRYGFEVLGTIRVGSSPPIIPMLRRPRLGRRGRRPEDHRPTRPSPVLSLSHL